MNLREALRTGRDEIISFVGAGGKTTAMFQLAHQLEPPVFVTTTTHLAFSQAQLADKHVETFPPAGTHEFDEYLASGVVLFTTGITRGDRLKGLSDHQICELAGFTKNYHVPLLIEADGARSLPIKAPDAFEPAIPPCSSHVVVVAGLSGIGKRLDGDTVHRVEQFSLISGRPKGEMILPEDLGRVLCDPKGGLKNIPDNAKRTVLLTQAKGVDFQRVVSPIREMTTKKFDSVILAELKDQAIISVTEKSTGIILAAGGSERFGTPKQLAHWKGKPLIRHVVENALASNLSEIIVVVGAVVDPLIRVIKDLPVKVIHNQEWIAGQGTSMHAGLKEIKPQSGSVLFLLSDQPQVSPDLINALLQHHSETLAPIIAPAYQGSRGNPVLFDRVTFPALKEINAETGGRAIFNQFPPQLLAWSNENILLDIDTPSDLERL